MTDSIPYLVPSQFQESIFLPLTVLKYWHRFTLKDVPPPPPSVGPCMQVYIDHRFLSEHSASLLSKFILSAGRCAPPICPIWQHNTYLDTCRMILHGAGSAAQRMSARGCGQHSTAIRSLLLSSSGASRHGSIVLC